MSQHASYAILGFGRAARAVATYLFAQGETFCVYAKGLTQGEKEEIGSLGGVCREGDFPDIFPEHFVVRSPGIRPDLPPIVKSCAAGSVLTGETELFLAHCPCRVIGVTGSDGKTTTCALIAAMCKAAGFRTWLGGNNGVPLLPRVGEMTEKDIVVLELSSFQLMTLQRSPAVAVVTNITPNHLNWHTDMAEYIAAKRQIFACGAARLILNAENAAALAFAADTAAPADTVLFCATPAPAFKGLSEVYIDGDDIVISDKEGTRRVSGRSAFSLPGRHNTENLLAAVAAVCDFVPPTAIFEALSQFRGVRHRLETVATVRGVRYINSSIDTSPTRTAAALSALDQKPVVLAGGRGKGISLTPLADTLAMRACAVFLYGETANEIARAIGTRVPTAVFERFEDAFFAAANAAKEGQCVLLSPGCTAFDQFRDFEERGEVFCRLVHALDTGVKE